MNIFHLQKINHVKIIIIHGGFIYTGTGRMISRNLNLFLGIIIKEYGLHKSLLWKSPKVPTRQNGVKKRYTGLL